MIEQTTEGLALIANQLVNELPVEELERRQHRSRNPYREVFLVHHSNHRTGFECNRKRGGNLGISIFLPNSDMPLTVESERELEHASAGSGNSSLVSHGFENPVHKECSRKYMTLSNESNGRILV